MFKAFLTIVATGVLSFVFTDIHSESAFFSVVLPLAVLFSAMALAVWFVLLFHKHGINQYAGGRAIDDGAPVAPDDFGGIGGDGDGSG